MYCVFVHMNTFDIVSGQSTQERTRFVRRAVKKADRISRNLEKIIELSVRQNCDCRQEDIQRIFEYIDNCVNSAKAHLLPEPKDYPTSNEAE